ncbi:MAG: MFS transporter [Chloroflexi bacterium]|nr:MFS transporter [Chloroflexota bacterium]
MPFAKDQPRVGGRGGATTVGWPAMFSSLSYRDFRWYWVSTMASFAAMQMREVATGWLIYDVTRSPLALASVSAAWGVPVLFLSLVGGMVTDRVNKQQLLIWSQVIMGGLSLVLGLLVTTGTVTLWHLLTISLLQGIVSAFNMPGRQAFIPHLVDRSNLMNAVALSSVAMNLTRIGGPALAGVLVALIGVAGVYYFIVLISIVSTVAMMLITPRETTPSSPQSHMGQEIALGLRYVAHSPAIQILIVTGLGFSLFAMPYQVLMPIFAGDVFNIGPKGLGLLLSMPGVGALVGSMVVAALGDFRRKDALLIASGTLMGIFLVLFALNGSLHLSLFFLTMVGVASSGSMAANNTLLQLNTSDEVRGRVMSIYMMVWGLQPLGTVPAGFLAQALGAPLAIALGGGALALLSIAARLHPIAWREMRLVGEESLVLASIKGSHVE